jgi:hypothetical protein
MPALYSVLGQARPTSIGTSTLFTASSALGTVISTLAITNTTDVTSQASVYLTTNPGGGSNANALLRTVDIFPKSTVALTLGVTLESGRVVDVQSSEPGALTFQAFGSEIS